MNEQELQELDDLKSEAAALGVKHNASIGASKLKEKIEAYYESQETSGPELEKLMEKVEEEEKEADVAPTGLDAKKAKRFAREAEAKKTRIVTITDNDQRVNNHTTTCVVTCASEYFSLGTRILPLNEKIEVANGHLGVLDGVQIPLHTRDPKTGLSVTKMRKRYSISYAE